MFVVCSLNETGHYKVWVSVFAVLVVFLACSSARAAQLTLVTSAPLGDPLVISPSKAQSPLLVSVVNSTATDPASQFMTGWQFRLVIEPDAGAMGSLQFNAGAKPSPYVFDSVGNLGAPSATVNGVFSALDTAIPTNVGVQIPTAPGANLQLVSFTPSMDAMGDFEIFAEGSSDTFWIDGNNTARPFVNVPGAAMVHLADVFVDPAGDFNRDGHVDARDIQPAMKALTDLTGYESQYSVSATNASLIADVNGDGSFTDADLQYLLNTLQARGWSANSVPEPSGLTLIVLAVSAVHLHRRRHVAQNRRGNACFWRTRKY